ncbi:hypothetical protein DTO282F9_7320 [Paecilomyces variotii]|nr:hypothetical protein DTO282F9_7320 [Paecilomyces variotii]
MISSADSPKQFRLWIFQVAVVLMHEVGGHLMVTFLGHGHVITPRIMTIAGFNSHVRPDNGESGRILETWLLGGVAEFQSDRRLRDDHPGKLWLIAPGAHKIRRIPSSTVDDFVSRRFTFPLRTEGPAVHITTRADFYAATQHLPDPYYYPWLHGGGMPPGVFDGHRVRISDLVRLPLSSFRPPRF